MKSSDSIRVEIDNNVTWLREIIDYCVLRIRDRNSSFSLSISISLN